MSLKAMKLPSLKEKIETANVVAEKPKKAGKAVKTLLGAVKKATKKVAKK